MQDVNVFIIDTSTNEVVECTIQKVNRSSLLSILRNNHFHFDWKLELTIEVYVLKLKDETALGLISMAIIPEELRIEIKLLESTKENIGKTKKYDGIAGCLIAFACREAFKKGFNGFVSLVPKTELINHYVHEYGFIQAGRHLATDLKNSKNLIDRYLNIGI